MIPIKRLVPRSLRRKYRHLKHKPSIAQLLARASALGSQAGQDYWVIFEAFNEKKGGYFVDVGAYDGINMSNTFSLENKYGWDGLCVEASPSIFKRLEMNRSSICVNKCIDASYREVSFNVSEGRSGISADNAAVHGDKVTTISLDTVLLEDVLIEAGAPNRIDYLSMDIEGGEENAFKVFPFDRYIFNTMTIERPSKYLKKLLGENGYRVVREIPGFDTFFIHKSFVKQYKKNLFEFYRRKRLRSIHR